MRLHFALVRAAALVLGASLTLTISCGPVHDIGRRLDALGRAAADYGTVSVSAPNLADAEIVTKRGYFAFNLTKTVDQFYNDARTDVNGVMASSFSFARENRIGFQGRANLENLYNNKFIRSRFEQDESEFNFSRRLQNTGQLLKLFLAMTDPEAAAALAAAEELKKQADAGNANANSSADANANANASGAGTNANGNSNSNANATPLTEEEKAEQKRRKELTDHLLALISMSSSTANGISTSRPALPQFQHDLPNVDDKILPDAEAVKEVLSDRKFSRFRELLASMPTSQPVIPNRSAILTAAGDNTVAGIMKFLGQPPLSAEWTDKRLLMGVAMVGVAPGTKTQRGYVADVSVACRCVWKPIRTRVLEEAIGAKDDFVIALTRAIGAQQFDRPATTDATHSEEWMRAADAYRDWRNAERECETQREVLNRTDLTQDQRAATDEKLHKYELKAEDAYAGYMRESMAFGPMPTAGLERDDAGAAGDPYNPNSRTKTDYYQLVRTGTKEGDFRLMRMWPNEIDRRTLQVFAASPMTEAQTLDQASSIRQQQVFALQLAFVVAGFGLEGQFKQLLEQVQKLEQDVATRTAMNTVAAYSNPGGVFGYQIGPSIQAMADFTPGGRQLGAKDWIAGLIDGIFVPGPDFILQRQSFPVLVMVGLDQDSARLVVAHTYEVDNSNKQLKEGIWYIAEPVIEFAQTTQWIPMKPNSARSFASTPPGISESERVNWAYQIDNARRLAKDVETETGLLGAQHNEWPAYYLNDYVRARTNILGSKLLLAKSNQPLPVSVLIKPTRNTGRPTIAKLIPEAIVAAAQDTKPAPAQSPSSDPAKPASEMDVIAVQIAVVGDQIDIIGKNLEKSKAVELIQIGNKADVSKLEINADASGKYGFITLELSAAKGKLPSALQFRVSWKTDKGEIQSELTPTIEVKGATRPKPAEPVAGGKKTFNMKRLFGAQAAPNVDEISVDEGVPPDWVRWMYDASQPAKPATKSGLKADAVVETDSEPRGEPGSVKVDVNVQQAPKNPE